MIKILWRKLYVIDVHIYVALIFYNFKICVCVHVNVCVRESLYVCMHTHLSGYLERAEVLRFPISRVTGSCELLDVGSEN